MGKLAFIISHALILLPVALFAAEFTQTYNFTGTQQQILPGNFGNRECLRGDGKAVDSNGKPIAAIQDYDDCAQFGTRICQITGAGYTGFSFVSEVIQMEAPITGIPNYPNAVGFKAKILSVTCKYNKP